MPDKYTLPPYVLSRVRYYDGEFLKDEDFIDEQKYHLDRSQRHQRLAHAAGIAEGLEVSVIQDQGVFKLKVSAGTAVDAQGRQILLGADLILPIKPEWTGTLWMTVRFNEKEDRPADANPATGGVGGNTRFTQEPIIDVVADLAPLQAQSPVVLGQVRFVAGQQPAILGTRTFAGVRLPGPGASSYALQVTEERGAARPVVVGLKGPLDVQDLNVSGKTGIGTSDPAARLSVVGVGASQLAGTVRSAALLVSAGGLGATQGNTLPITSLGFSSSNNSFLGVRAYRTANGTDWTTTSIGLSMDVDNTPEAGARLYLSASGGVGIGIQAPRAKLHVAGDSLFTGSLVLGAGGNGSLRVRHIDGKLDGSDDPDHLYLNWGTGKLVVLGNPNAPSGLEVHGDINIHQAPATDTTASLSRLALSNRGANGQTKTWTLYTAAVGGGFGVTPNAFEIWEYPATASRFQLRPGGNTLLSPSGGNVGIGTLDPSARLSIVSTGASQLAGTVRSAALLVSAGGLGTTQGNTLPITSLGFASSNNSFLGIRAYRTANGTDWTTTSIGLSMDVDNTLGAGASLYLSASGGVGIGIQAPKAKLHVAGDSLLTGNLVLGAGGNGSLRVRHVDGKLAGSDDVDHLYLNWGTGKLVVLGNPGTHSGLEVYGAVKIYGDRLRNSAGYSVFQMNATDWLRLNPDENYPATAVYKSMALGSGGLSVGDWSVQPHGQLLVTGNAFVNGNIHEGGRWIGDKYAFRDHLRANNGAHYIVMQDDRNFVLYSGGRAVWSSGTSTSDATMKQDVKPITEAMAKLRQVQGVSFFWKQGELGTERELGVLAQEVETVFPELVQLIDGKHRLVRYEKFVPVLIQALREQDERIARLEERLRTLGATA